MVRVLLRPERPDGPPSRSPSPASTARAAAGLHGLLVLEVDGLDLLGGRAEGPLWPMAEALLEAVASLVAGHPRAALPLREGALLLTLRRRGGEIGLALFELGPPSRLLARAAGLDLGALAGACRAAAAEGARLLSPKGKAGAPLAGRLRLLGRRLAAEPEAGWPGALQGGLDEAGEAPPRDQAGAAPAAGLLRCLVELDDPAEDLGAGPDEPLDLGALLAPGRLELAAPGGPVASLEGAPFLTLLDLVAAAEEAVGARRRHEPSLRVELRPPGRAAPLTLLLDLAGGRVLGPDGADLGSGPVDLAEATAAALERFGVLATRAGQGANPHLAEARRRAAEAARELRTLLAGDAAYVDAPPPGTARARPSARSLRPLGPGALRRVALRVTGEAHVGEPVGAGLAQAGPVALAIGRDGVAGLGARRTWQGPGADWGAVACATLLLRRGDALCALDPATGAVRWEQPLPGGRPTALAGAAGGPLLLGEPDAVTALDPASGRRRWRLEWPGGTGLALAVLGDLVVTASASGLVHALRAADGALAWRLCGPGPALAPAQLCGSRLATLHATGATGALLFIDPRAGGRRGEVDLDVRPSGPLARLGGGLVVAGRSGGAGVLVLADPRRGRAWEVEVPLAGAVRLTPAGRALLAGDDAGGLALLDSAGRLRWSLPSDGSEGGAAPAVSRQLAAAARGGLSLIDLGDGEVVARAPGLSPHRLAADAGLGLTVLEADGAVTRLQPTGHLSVLG